MKAFVQYIILFFLLCSSFALMAQSNNFQNTLQRVETTLLAFDAEQNLKFLDAELKRYANVPEKNVILKGLKVEALVQAALFEEALVLSNSIINLKYLTGNYKIRVLLQRALIYEWLEKFPQSKKELDAVSGIFKDKGRFGRNKYYGEYLYRMSSYYRVQRLDSIALPYALKSKQYADSYGYKDVSAVASMLLAFISESNIESREHLSTALNTWKQYGDNNGVAAMFAALAQSYSKEDKYALALKYADSAVFYAKKTLRFQSYGSAYKLKSRCFEKLQQPDSALHYYKLYHTVYGEQSIEKERMKVYELEFNFELQKEQIKKDQVFTDNQQIKNFNKKLVLYIIIMGVSLCLVIFLMYMVSRNNKKILQQKNFIQSVNNDLSNSVKQKEVLFKELHHRVKNNLALILSLVEFQSNEIDDPEYVNKFTTLKNRIGAIAIVHKQFLAQNSSDFDGEQSIKHYTDQIVQAVINLDSRTIIYSSIIENVFLPIDKAVPIGILVNELVSNTIKHARPANGNDIEIELKIVKTSNGLIVDYKDNGSLFNNNFRQNSLGIFIIESMISQLEGNHTREKSHYKIFLNTQL